MTTEDRPVVVHRVCATSDVPIGEARRFVVGGVPVCLAHLDDGYHAIGDVCSHADYSLSAGDIDSEACEVECPQHGSLFSLMTGEPSTLPATEPVPVFRVGVDGDDVVMYSR